MGYYELMQLFHHKLDTEKQGLVIQKRWLLRHWHLELLLKGEHVSPFGKCTWCHYQLLRH